MPGCGVPCSGGVSTAADVALFYQALLDEVNRAKPASAKGRYLRGVSTSSTMGPGVRIDPAAKAEEKAGAPTG